MFVMEKVLLFSRVSEVSGCITIVLTDGSKCNRLEKWMNSKDWIISLFLVFDYKLKQGKKFCLCLLEGMYFEWLIFNYVLRGLEQCKWH